MAAVPGALKTALGEVLGKVAESWATAPTGEDLQAAVDLELASLYAKTGSFSLGRAWTNVGHMSNSFWWESYGASAPLCQRLASELFAMATSQTSVERLWGGLASIKSGRRWGLSEGSLQKMLRIWCGLGSPARPA